MKYHFFITQQFYYSLLQYNFYKFLKNNMEIEKRSQTCEPASRKNIRKKTIHMPKQVGQIQEIIKYNELYNDNLISNNLYNQASPKQKLNYQQWINIQPKQLNFDKKIEGPQILYLTIQNISKENIKFMIQNPSTKYFKIKQQIRSINLSSGLSKRFPIEFNTKPLKTNKENEILKLNSPDEDYYDEVMIISERIEQINIVEFKENVKLVSRSALVDVRYKVIEDLGYVELRKTSKFQLSFWNTSKSAKQVRLDRQHWDTMVLNQQAFVLNSGEKIEISCMVQPAIPGAYHHKLSVFVNEKRVNQIEVLYTAFCFQYFIQNSKGQPLSQIDFGCLLRGQTKSISIFAVNNSPQSIEVRARMKIEKSQTGENSLQTPKELGIQSSSTVIDIKQKNCIIQPFNKKEIALFNQTKIQPQHILFAERYAFSETINKIQKNQCHEEVLICQFSKINEESKHQKNGTSWMCSKNQNKNNNVQNKNLILMPVKIQYAVPYIKINPSALDIGTFHLGDTLITNFTMKNMKQSMKYHVKFQKTAGIECFLMKNTDLINESEEVQVQVLVKGLSLGIFQSKIEMVINNIYKMSLPISYNIIYMKKQPNTVQNQSISIFQESKQINFNATIQMREKYLHRLKYSSHSSHQLRRNKYKNTSNSKECTNTALEGENIKNLRNSCNSHRKEKSQIKHQNQKQSYNVDHDICCALPSNQMKNQISQKSYGLFVTKKYNKYMPFDEAKDQTKLTKTKNKEQFHFSIKRGPKNRKEIEEITRELTSEELKEISINQKVIKMGKLFLNSKVERQFVIENGNEKMISVKLQISDGESRKSNLFDSTEYGEQVLGSNCAGKFKIILNASLCGKIQQIFTYIINGIHTFQFLVEAQIELVTLTISKNNLKMSYLDDTTEMFLKESFTLKNQGNIPASYEILQSNQRFLIEPCSGILRNGESTLIKVVQNSNKFLRMQAIDTLSFVNSNNNKTNAIVIDERINIKIKDGNDISLRVQSNAGLNEPKVCIKEAKLSFGCNIVSKSKTKSFLLKNLTRNICLFQIINQECQQYLTFSSLQGRIPPEGSKQFEVTYKSSEIHHLNSCFKILIRGGLIISMPIQAESNAPEVSIVQNIFDFAEICCGAADIKPINIRNDSEIATQIFLDLRSKKQKGLQFLSVYIPPVVPSKKQVKVKSVQSNIVLKKQLQKQKIIDEAVNDQQIHRIKMQAKSVLTLYLVLKPLVPGYYEFLLPLFLENNIKNDGIIREVTCCAIEPKFIIEPSVIKFKRKVITEKETSIFHPFIESILLKNPTNKVLKWKIGTLHHKNTNNSFSSMGSSSAFGSLSKKIQNYEHKMGVFEIEQKRGEVKPQEYSHINVSFNPLEEGTYHLKVPLMIFNEEKGMYYQEAEIRLDGEGQYPSLYFNQKQLILPVVPLGIQSIGMVQIFNEGYQNICLNHRIEIVDQEGSLLASKGNLIGNLSLPEIIVIYPQGNKLGVNRKSLFALVKFASKKSISFTCKVTFFDDLIDGRTYSLILSGTADNSLLTNYQYLSDSENIFKYEVLDHQKDQLNKKVQNQEINKLIVNLKTNDGRNVIDRYHDRLDEKIIQNYVVDCTVIKRWLNFFLKEEKVMNFPADFRSNPDSFIKFLQKITGKKEFQSYSYVLTEIKDSRQSQALSQADINSSYMEVYKYLIKHLKSLGCLLNHIRPEMLLEKNQYIMQMSKEKHWNHYSQHYLSRYEVLHVEAWTSLLYQLINHFWCQKYKKESESKYLTVSNVYNESELQVMRWMKTTYEKQNELEDSKNRFLNFGEDMKDCLAPIYCLLHYSLGVKKHKILQSLVKKPLTPNQYQSNIKILFNLVDKLNIVPLIYQDEYSSCSQKQIFLFMLQLFESLPQNLPKQPPLIFQCKLGESCVKSIEIKNPFKKAIHYWVKIEGSKDFYCQENQSLVIEPKSQIKFKVEFKSRLSSEQVAFIKFYSKQQSDGCSTNGATIVFELKSQITGRKSIKKLEPLYCPLYEMLSTKISVQNPFEDVEYGNFNIYIFEEQIDDTKKERHSIQNILPISLKKSQSTSGIATPENAPPKNVNFTSTKELNLNLENKKSKQFFTEIETIKIKKNSSSTFQLFFNPLSLSKAKCYLIFFDPSVGQFQYEILTYAELPKPLQEIKCQQTIYVGVKDTIQVNLPVYNNYLLKAQSFLDQRLNTTQRGKIKLQKIQNQEEKFKIQVNMESKIEEFITFPSEIILKNFKKDSVSALEYQTKIKIPCFFSLAIKDLYLDFLLINEAKTDIRRFRVGLNITHQPLIQELLMMTTARKAIIQALPIENISSKDWKVKVSILESDSTHFSLKEKEKCLSKEIIIKKGQTQSAVIIYDPDWVSKSSCKLHILNLITNEQIFYHIKGIAEEPISENHIHLKLNTGETEIKAIQIVNPYNQKKIFKVISDLEEISFSPEILLDPHESTRFNIIITYSFHMTQVGYIKFIDEEGKFLWYSITIEPNQKKIIQQEIDLCCTVDTEVQKTIALTNPYSRPATFQVEIPKKYALSGLEHFVVQPKSNYNYTFTFFPHQPLSCETNIKIASKEIGLFVYKLKLQAKEQLKRKVHNLNVEVGKKGFLEFKIQNISLHTVILDYSITNGSHFQVELEKRINPTSEKTMRVSYKPSCQGKQKCIIKITGQYFQARCFEIEAAGIAPFSLEVLDFKLATHDTYALEVIKFNNPNPLQNTEKVSITLIDNANSKDVFHIISEKSSTYLQTSVTDTLAIPIKFEPKYEGVFQSILRIECHNFQWKYLLKGTNCASERKNQSIRDQIICENKKQVIKIIQIPIPSYYEDQSGLQYENKISIEHHDKKIQKLLRNWLKVKLNAQDQNDQQTQEKCQNKYLTAYLKFHPKRSLNETATIIIVNSKDNNRKISHKIQLISKRGGPEQTLSLNIDAIKKINFELNLASKINKSLISVKMLKQNTCEAELAKSKANVINIRFTPTHLIFSKDKTYHDILILESQEEEWVFQVDIKLNRQEK